MGEGQAEQDLGRQERPARAFVLGGPGLGMVAPGASSGRSICAPCPPPQSRSGFGPSFIVWCWALPSPGLWTPSNSCQPSPYQEPKGSHVGLLLTWAGRAVVCFGVPASGAARAERMCTQRRELRPCLQVSLRTAAWPTTPVFGPASSGTPRVTGAKK